MSFLEKAKRACEELNAPIFTIIGSPGSGKTTLGGLFPDAIFMQSERAGTVFGSWKKNHPTLLPPLYEATKAHRAHWRARAIQEAQDLE